MKLEITNGSLQSIIEYLPKLKGLTGRENRARQKLIKKLSEKFQEFYSDMQEINSEYSDDDAKRKDELTELLKEDITIDMTEYEKYMPLFLDTLLDYNYGIDTAKREGLPSDSTIHDYLIDVLESATDEGNNDLPNINTDAANNVEEAQYQEVE